MFVSLGVASRAQRAEVDIFFNHSVAPVQFAVADISKALQAKQESPVLKNLKSIVSIKRKSRNRHRGLNGRG